MKKNHRFLAILTALCLLGTLVPASVLATEGQMPGHLDDCSYRCNHIHGEDCGYVEAVEGQDCTHVHEHDDACGYAEGRDAVSCPNGEDCTGEEDGHVEPQAAVPGSACNYTHEHDESCGYAEAVEGVPCNHQCGEDEWVCAEGCPVADGQVGSNALEGLVLYADSIDLADGPITVASGSYTQNGETYEYQDILTITQTSDVTENTIEIDGTASVVISGVNIQAKESSAIRVTGAVDLILSGENTVVGGTRSYACKAGISVATDASLSISGEGSLTALGGADRQSVNRGEYYTWSRGACGIGADYQSSGVPQSGAVSILSGMVTARGMGGGSGISGTEITILNGTVNAYAYRDDVDGSVRQGDGYGYGIGGRGTSSVVVKGGEIHAFGGPQGAGIGGSAVEITGGLIEAVGGVQGAGVGAGLGMSTASRVEISGGTVNATGGSAAPGVGAMGSVSGSAVHITGTANVTAIGGNEAAGVGCGTRSNPATGVAIYIDGAANVTATGGDTDTSGGYLGAGAGIGNAGYSTAPSSIIIDTVGTVKAQGGTNRGAVYDNGGTYCGGAGIGGAENYSGGNIQIKNGLIEATGGAGGAGIGGGAYGTSGVIAITGGTIKSTGTGDGAGIGSGLRGNVDSISVSGGDIAAVGGKYGAGIGSGYGGDIGTIEITGGTVSATTTNAGAGIGGGQENGSGTISLTGGSIFAASGYVYATSAIGGGYAGASAQVTIGGDAQVWAFNYGYGSQSYAAKPAIDMLTAESTANVVSGLFNQGHAFDGTEIALDGRSASAPAKYCGFAATVSGEGTYEVTTQRDGMEKIAVSGSGEDAITALLPGTGYENLYWAERPASGEPFQPTEPDPFTPDDSWMDDYTGGATYDPATGTTTVSGSITNGIYLFVIPEEAKGTVVLDGTGYVNALIHRYTGSAGTYWNPGSFSGTLPIKVVNHSGLKYVYADAGFGIDESAGPDDAYFIGGQLNRPAEMGDKVILRTPAQPLMALYGRSTSSVITVEEILNAEEKIAALGIDGVETYGDYVVYYYRDVLQYPGAETAASVGDLPLACKLNIMGYASPLFDFQNKLMLGNTGVAMDSAAAEKTISGLSQEDQQRVITGDPINGRTTVCVAETDQELLNMGYEVLYTYGVAFTFDSGRDTIVSGDTNSTEEFTKFVNEELGWLTLSRADFSSQALSGDNLSEAQTSMAATVGTLSLEAGGEQNIERAQLSMPGYAIPNAMFSVAGLRGLTMSITLAPVEVPDDPYVPPYEPPYEPPYVPPVTPVTPVTPVIPTTPETPELDIPEGDVPTADLPELPVTPAEPENPGETVIVEEEVPLGNLPQTGTVAAEANPALTLGAVALALSLALAGVTVLVSRKKEDAE